MNVHDKCERQVCVCSWRCAKVKCMEAYCHGAALERERERERDRNGEREVERAERKTEKERERKRKRESA